jgi:HK97 family phage major capsid protein
MKKHKLQTLGFSDSGLNARRNAWALRCAAFAIIGVFGVTLMFAFSANPELLVAPMLALPVIDPFGFGGARRFLKNDAGGGGGTAQFTDEELGDMSEQQFRSTLMGTLTGRIADVKKQINDQVEGWQKENKKTVEELTQLKNAGADVQEMSKKMKQVLDAREREYSLATASMSPIRRIAENPVKRAALNGLVRLACSKSGDLDGVAAAITKDLDTGTTPGSTYLGQQVLPEVYDALGTYGIWNTLGVRRVGTKATTIPVKTARAIGAFIDEAGSITSDATKAGTGATLTVKKAAVLLAISRELLQDSELDVTTDVLNDFAEALAERLDWAFFCGTGAADQTNGGFTGVFEAGTAAVAAAGTTTVASLQLEDFTNVLTKVAPVVLQRPSKWWIHPTQIARIMSVKDGNGRPLFMTAIEAPAYGGLGSILGYGVIPGHVLPSTEAASAKIAAFGDPQGYVVGLRQDMEITSSDHVFFDTDERAFRGIVRAGGRIRRADAFGILTLPAA